MKNIKICFITAIILFSLASCNFFIRITHKHKNNEYNGHTNCYISPKQDTMSLRWYKSFYVNKIDFKKRDTVVSIGVGGGWREFLYSVFTDSITFYMEDMDTSCITREKIKNEYLPHYSDIRCSKITNEFIPAIGTDTTVNLKNNLANKVVIVNTYHHFSNDKAMVKECRRILKENGKLIIGEFVMRKNKHSYKHCPVGGNYKSENNFVKDIVDIGFNCDTIYRSGRHYRLFVFSKY